MKERRRGSKLGLSKGPIFFSFFLILFSGLQSTNAEINDALPKTNEVITIGVLATEGATRAMEAWGPTIKALNDSAHADEIGFGFHLSPQSHGTLENALNEQEVDLFLADPASFVAAEVEHGARAILSTGYIWNGTAQDLTGAVIFSRADSGIRRIEQLRGRSIMAVAPNDFAGWRLVEQEFRNHRLEPRSHFSELVYSGGNEREVIYAVRSGLVDAGVVRSGLLESLAQSDAIALSDFAPISLRNHEDFPFWSSTPLYPQWVLAAMPHVSEDALAYIINSLLAGSAESPLSLAAGSAVWQAPQNYQPVHDLLISLRARPYENYLQQAFNRILRAYHWQILSVSALIVLSLAFLFYELRRNMRLAEARRNVLQSEVRSKAFYRSAIEEHTIFCMLDRAGHISHVNEKFIQVTKRSRAKLVNEQIVDLLDERDGDKLSLEVMSSMEMCEPWQGSVRIKQEDGTTIWAQCTFVPVTGISDRLSEIAIVATDVTQTRQGASESRFHNTLELIQDQVIVMRPGNLELIYCNEAAQKTLISERMGGEWIGERVQKFVTNDDYESLLLRCQALEEGPQRRVTWEVEGKKGVTYEISLEYVQPEQEEDRFIAIYRDISERKIAEKTKNEFIATVSHELRTPLTSIKGALGVALSGATGEMPAKLDKLINMANSNCERLVTLINDILDLEKIEAGKMDFKMELIDLTSLVESALEANHFYAEKFGVRYQKSIEPNENKYLTIGDRDRLRQVMDNLMSNAAKFSAKGADILVSLTRYKGRLRISVRDYGVGIPQSAQASIFDKFTQVDSSDTRSKGGTGLGLSIAKLIVEAHCGNIFFVSDEKYGTEFFVDLPEAKGESVVPMPALSEEEILAPCFSDQAKDHIAEDVSAGGKAAVDMLLDKFRQSQAAIEVESGKVTTAQVARGRGVVGQSTVLNWIGNDGRDFVSDLLQRDLIKNLEVLVFEIHGWEGIGSHPAERRLSTLQLFSNWITAIEDIAGTKQKDEISHIHLGLDTEATNFSQHQRAVIVDEPAQALAYAEQERPACILAQGRGELADTVMFYPLNVNELPDGLPLIIAVIRNEMRQVERGVVSKFTSGDAGGRSRARRRLAS